MAIFGGLGCKIETGKLYKARPWYSTGSERWASIWLPAEDGSWWPSKLSVGSILMVLDENPTLLKLVTTFGVSHREIPHIQVFSAQLERTGMIDPNQLEEISE